MKLNKTILAVPALLAAAAVLYPFLQRPAALAANPAPPEQDSARWIAGAGRVEPQSEEVRIAADLDGRLASVPVQEGDHVTRGQIVAIIENDDFAARVRIAGAAVAERRAELERVVNGSRIEQRLEAEALVREAGAALEHAKAEQQRRTALFHNGLIARTEFDLGEREYGLAQARHDSARQRAALVLYESRPEDFRRAQAALERAHAERAEAEALLARTVIRAPLAGVVLRKLRKTGEGVSATSQTVILALGDCSRLRVRMDVDENDVGRLRIGQAAWVRADAFGDRRFPGVVVQIGQAVGRKNVFTGEPTEKLDANVLETLIELVPETRIPVGLRVDAYIDTQHPPRLRGEADSLDRTIGNRTSAE
jgi:HlyD family secretion protein